MFLSSSSTGLYFSAVARASRRGHVGYLAWPEWWFFFTRLQRGKACAAEAEEIRCTSVSHADVPILSSSSALQQLSVMCHSQIQEVFHLTTVVAPHTYQNTNYKQDKRAHWLCWELSASCAAHRCTKTAPGLQATDTCIIRLLNRCCCDLGVA